MAKLPKIRSHWPKQVTLRSKAYFNIMEGGRVVGLLAMEAGTVLPLVEVKPEHAFVLVQGSPSPLPVEQCDLVERLGGESAILLMADDPAMAAPAAVGNTKQNGVKVMVDDEAALLAKLSRLRGRWPKEVKLREKCDFPIFEAGRFLGNRSEEPGTVLQLLSAEKQGVVVLSANSPSMVRLAQTDLVDRLGGMGAVMAMPDDPPEAPAKPAVPAESTNR